MDTLAIFGLQLALSLIVYGLIAKWYVTPWLAEKPIHQALTPLIFPHAFRHLGVFGPRVGCPTSAELFCLRGCLWGLCQRPARTTVSGSSSSTLETGAPVGVAFQHCWHDGPSKCTAPGGSCTAFADQKLLEYPEGYLQ